MAGIAGEVVVFKGIFDPVLGHAIGISGDTERYAAAGLGFGLAGGGAVEQEGAFAGVLGEGGGEFELGVGFGGAI
jgi:hypothetical protein